MYIIRCGDREFKNIQGIIFDKDGTLEDSREYWREVAIARVRAIESRIPGLEKSLRLAYGLRDGDLDPMGLMAVGSRRDNEIATAAYITATGRDWWSSLAIARQGFEEVDRTVPARLNPLYPGCQKAIRQLADAGFRLAILSADTTARVEEFVKGNGLGDCIAVAIGSDRGRSKPDPLLAIETCRELGISIGNTLMVGDTVGDMEMARKAGAAGAIGINWRGDTVRGADVSISTLEAIVAVG